MSALTEKLAAKKQKQSDTWKPETVGDTLEGKVLEIGDTITEYGDARYAHIETANSKVTVWLNSVLQQQFEDEKVQEGDVIAIEYTGQTKSKNGKRVYKSFVVVKDTEDDNSGEVA